MHPCTTVHFCVRHETARVRNSSKKLTLTDVLSCFRDVPVLNVHNVSKCLRPIVDKLKSTQIYWSSIRRRQEKFHALEAGNGISWSETPDSEPRFFVFVCAFGRRNAEGKFVDLHVTELELLRPAFVNSNHSPPNAVYRVDAENGERCICIIPCNKSMRRIGLFPIQEQGTSTSSQLSLRAICDSFLQITSHASGYHSRSA